MSNAYKRPDQLPKRLQREVWVAPVRQPVALALPKVDGAVANRFRTERPAAAPAVPHHRPPAATIPESVPVPTFAPTTAMPVTDSGGPSVISIQINLPKLALPNVKTSLKQQTSRLSQAQRRRLKLGAAIIATLMLVSSVGLAAQHFLAHRSAVAAAKATLAKSAAASTAAKPTFQPLAPVDSTNNGIHGTPQVAYDGKRNTYSFTDTLAGQAIVVSQQPIPATYKTAVDAVSKIAVSLKASQTLATSSGAAFIANDAKSNAQTIVFSKNNLLVFVQSPFAHTSDQWQAYINGLQTQ